MTRADDARAALEAVPGWAGARVSRLAGGETDSAWLVERDADRAVLKFDEAPRDPPLNRRNAEAAVQSAAAAEGLANPVVYADETVLLSVYAEGRSSCVRDFEEPGMLDALAVALRRVHSLPLTGRTFDAVGAATRYFDALVDADPVIAESCLRTVREAPAPANLCCCHNDLVAGNILLADGFRFIDWEFACDNDPFFDLATIVVEQQLTNAGVSRLLDAYFDGDGERWQDRLAEQERLYDALAWLWRESQSRI